MIEHRVSLVATSGAPPSCGARVSHCGGFSYCGARALDGYLAWADRLNRHLLVPF